MCSQIGVDYCAYWSAGTVANHQGYAGVYDVRLLGPVEQSTLPVQTGASSVGVVPFLYPAVFVPPFQLFALLRPGIGFWLWTILNAIALLLYLRFLARSLQLEPLPSRVMVMVFVCLPSFMNIFLGQMDLWLAVSVGEFMRSMLDHRPFRAGLWLGGLLLKPQVLILIALVLLIQRSLRILIGLVASSSALAVISLLMTGPSGFIAMLKLWLTYGNAAVNLLWVEGMMNWRMLGLHLSNLTAPWIGWSIAGAGMLVTLAAMLYIWRKPFDPDLPSFPVAMIGIMTAAAVVTWHSHIHMAVMLIPPLVYAYQSGLLPQRAMDFWIFFPAILYAAMVFIPETLIALGIVSTTVTPLIYFSIGMGEFAANIYMFAWAVRSSIQRPKELAFASVE